MRVSRATVIALMLLMVLAPAFFADASGPLSAETKGAAAGSRSSKGGEFAIKLVSGMLYDTTCSSPNQTEMQFVCDALGNVTAKTDKVWLKRVDAQLRKMSSQQNLNSIGC